MEEFEINIEENLSYTMTFQRHSNFQIQQIDFDLKTYTRI